MALTDWTTFTAITDKFVLDGLADQIFGSNTIWKRAMQGGRIKKPAHGTSCTFRVQYAKTTAAGTFTGRDIVETAPNETASRGELPWGGFYTTVSIDGDQIDQNQGKEAIGNFLQEEIDNAVETLKDNVATGLFSKGTDAKGIVGLRQAVCDSNYYSTEGVSASYAGIDRSSYSWWNANVDYNSGNYATNYVRANVAPTGTTNAYTLPYLIRKLYMSCMQGTDSDRVPTVIYTSKSIYECYMEWAQSKGQIPMIGVGTTTDKQRADFGFQELSFMGIPWIVDSHCPTNYLYMLNENRIFFQPLATKEIRKTSWKYAHNQIEVGVMEMYIKGQLLLTEPRSCGVLVLSPTASTGFDY